MNLNKCIFNSKTPSNRSKNLKSKQIKKNLKLRSAFSNMVKEQNHLQWTLLFKINSFVYWYKDQFFVRLEYGYSKPFSLPSYFLLNFFSRSLTLRDWNIKKIKIYELKYKIQTKYEKIKKTKNLELKGAIKLW
jgi:hypothetical protein